MATDPFSTFDPVNGNPVTIVFGTFNYRRIIRKWINHAESSCDHWRIICLDQELVGWLNEIGHGSRAVYFYDLFPNMHQYGLDNMRGCIIFRKIRPQLWCALADSGRDFIHSDADAFWLQDPRPWLLKHTAFDLLISQGTFSPMPQFARHHFVLCAGFFFCRANARTQDYFRRVKKAKMIDQLVMNKLLLHDPNMRWQIHQPAIFWSKTGRLRHPLYKTTTVLRYTPIWLFNFRKWLSRRHYLKMLCPLINRFIFFIYISSEVIKGSASDGLTVGVIPMHLVTRIKQEPVPSTLPLVSHEFNNKKKSTSTNP